MMAIPYSLTWRGPTGQGRILDYTALISGLIGALIGASASLGGCGCKMFTRIGESPPGSLRHRLQGLRTRIEHREQNIAPFPVLLDYHQQMMSLVHKGELTPDLVTKIFERQGVMTAAVLKALDSPQEPASQPESQT
jgi:hypothetical protein